MVHPGLSRHGKILELVYITMGSHMQCGTVDLQHVLLHALLSNCIIYPLFIMYVTLNTCK